VKAKKIEGRMEKERPPKKTEGKGRGKVLDKEKMKRVEKIRRGTREYKGNQKQGHSERG